MSRSCSTEALAARSCRVVVEPQGYETPLEKPFQRKAASSFERPRSRQEAGKASLGSFQGTTGGLGV